MIQSGVKGRKISSRSAFAFFAFVLVFGFALCAEAVGPRKVVDDIAIHDLNLLLPLTNGKVKASYSLKAYNGCFKWTTTNPEVVIVDPIYTSDTCGDKKNIQKNPFFEETPSDSGCSTECIVSVTQNSLERRSSSFIIAEDLISGRKVRCEVYVDKIQRIEIETTSRRMYHDDVEELTVLGFDSIGNLFSTLEGLQFQWSIVAANPNTPTPPLKFIPFAESNIEVSDVLLDMERQGKESYAVLVKGVESGKVHVNTRLVELGYNLVDQSSVMISVLEPLELHPLQPVYLTPGTMIQYELKTFKNEYTRTIPMPNAQYIWGTTNQTVASVNNRGLVQALQLGSTDVIVQYEDMSENNAQGHVTVVWPALLALKIVPLTEEGTGNIGATSTNWYLVNGRSYSLTVEVYDAHSHRILTSPDMEFSVDLPVESFGVTDHSRNHAQHSIVARKEGLTQISARLTNLIDSRTRQKITLPVPLVVRQEVVISPPVVVSPSHLRFPYDNSIRQGHNYPLRATGGTNEYNWYSADNTVTTVNSRGLVTSGTFGETQVMAADTKNPTNRGLCKVSVLPVGSIKIIPLRREALVGDKLILAIAFYDNEGNLFDNCTSLSFKWSISDQSVFSAIPTDFNVNELSAEQRATIGQACTFRSVQALREGYANIVVSFGSLKSDITFFAYDQLKVEPSQALVSLGSSFLYEVHGGPNPWYFEPGSYRGALTADKPNLIRVETVTGEGGKNNFRVTCLDHGEQTITISTGNRPTVSNPFPATSVSTATFSCYLPTSLFIHPAMSEKQKSPNSCDDSYYWNLNSQSDYSSLPATFSVKNNQELPFQASLLDYDGKKFDNFTSLEFKWDSNNPIIAKFDSSRKNIPTNQRVLEIFDKSGKASISAQIAGFNSNILNKASVSSDISRLQRLRKEVSLNVLENVSLQPQRQMLFLHSSNRGFIDIIGGSPSNSITSNDTNAVELYRTETQAKRVEIIPKAAGNIRLTVNDNCLQGSNEANAFIRIAPIGRIQLEVPSAIPVGEAREFILSVYDPQGNLFDPSQYKYMRLQSHQDNHLINIEPETNRPNHFVVRGISPGSSSISFHSIESSVSSDTKSIYVYPPFTIEPESLSLAPGISYQLQVHGGPPSGISVSYESTKPSIASVGSDGIVKAHSIGTTSIRAIAEGFDSVTGQSVQYGDAEILLTVRDITDIQIRHPSNVIVVGSEMNVMAFGPQGETPFYYGTDMIWDWEGSNTDVLDIVPRFAESGCSLEDEKMFSATLRAIKPGRSRVTVRTDRPNANLLSRKKHLEGSIIINVIERLELISRENVLLTPHTLYKIETNLDYLSSLQYSVLGYNCQSDYNPCEVSSSGEIKTSARTGNCFVLVHEPDTAQSVIVQVDVKPLDMMQITPISENNAVQLTLPLGEQMEFQIRYLDDLAREFDRVYLSDEFKVSTNAQEIISYRILASAHRIFVQGLRPGSAVLRVGKTSDIDDYIHIRVGNSILPRSPTIHVGGEVSFRPQFSKDSINDNPTWRSANPSIVSIDSRTGVARALQVGKTSIIYSTTEYENSVHVTVVQIDQIGTMLSENDRSVSNYNRGSKPYRIPLQFWSSGLDLNVTSMNDGMLNNNVVVKCSITPSSWASARSVINEEGAFCFISLHEMKSINLANQVIPELLNLHISVSDVKSSYLYETATVLPFYPEFVLVGSNTNQMHLYRNRPHGQIQIKHGLSELSVIGGEGISVHQISSHLDLAVYEVQVTDLEHSLTSSVTVLSPSTGQERVVEVIYTNTNALLDDGWEYAAQPALDNSQRTRTSMIEKKQPSSSASSLIFLTLVTIGAVLLGYFFFKPTTPAAVSAIKSPSRSGGDSTPKRNTNTQYAYHEHSPFTPPVTPFYSASPRT